MHLSVLSHDALTGAGGEVSTQLERAVRLYLRDAGSQRPGWPFPAHLRDARAGGLELRVEVDEDLWVELEGEAHRQAVSVSQMAAHAVLYYAAELDSGRVAKRILDDPD